MRTIEEVVDEIEDIEIDDINVGRSTAVAERLDEILEIHRAEKVIGHWFVDERPESDREIICSNCEQPIFKYHKLDFDYRPNFCPNCGVNMREPKGEKGETHGKYK